jgi:hypothetical protein
MPLVDVSGIDLKSIRLNCIQSKHRPLRISMTGALVLALAVILQMLHRWTTYATLALVML